MDCAASSAKRFLKNKKMQEERYRFPITLSFRVRDKAAAAALVKQARFFFAGRLRRVGHC